MQDAHGDATIRPDSTLDATGLLCPLPVLKARRALKSVPPGGILEVLATDPGATNDFTAFLPDDRMRAAGNQAKNPVACCGLCLKKPG